MEMAYESLTLENKSYIYYEFNFEIFSTEIENIKC